MAEAGGEGLSDPSQQDSAVGHGAAAQEENCGVMEDQMAAQTNKPDKKPVEQARIIRLFHSIEYYLDYDYKEQRKKR